MIQVVIDTNIIISAAISKNGNPAKIVNMALDKSIQVHYSTAMMNEYEEVLSRSEFSFDSEQQNAFIFGLKKTGIHIDPVVSDVQMSDEDDRIFYDTAKASGAILITGNTRHYPNEPFIMTPSDFLSIYESANKTEEETPVNGA
ncbi:MAG: putative toxin-antitoxin system toxin component, PIN family [Clostridiales bacterium]|nr:putative toxin-antitoxin system toxin component, PIN family [Clostridiales bacterium]